MPEKASVCLLCPAAAAVTVKRRCTSCPCPAQVRKDDWITADGTTLGSDNGGRGVVGKNRARQEGRVDT